MLFDRNHWKWSLIITKNYLLYCALFIISWSNPKLWPLFINPSGAFNTGIVFPLTSYYQPFLMRMHTYICTDTNVHGHTQIFCLFTDYLCGGILDVRQVKYFVLWTEEQIVLTISWSKLCFVIACTHYICSLFVTC